MAKEKHANISLFVPHLGCPQQCSFCDQRAITGAGAALPTPADVWAAARRGAETLGPRREQAELAFFGGSFTAIGRADMLALLTAAKEAVEHFGLRGVRCSTRPDAIDPEVLAVLRAHRATAVELGAQSMDDGVLAANSRGHTAAQTAAAAELIRQAGLELGLQMMTGLFASTPEKDLSTAKRLVELRPATVRVYPAIVLPHTRLAKLYDEGGYRPQTLDEAIELCAALLELFEGAGVRVIRMGLHPSPELEARRLAGPYHPAFRQLAESRRFLRRLLASLRPLGPGAYQVETAPRDISTALGQKKENLARLRAAGYDVRFVQQRDLAPGAYRLRREEGLPRPKEEKLGLAPE